MNIGMQQWLQAAPISHDRAELEISNWENTMNNRQSPVPEGHATIAQRFNVGLISSERSSPEGTAETARDPSAIPSGLPTGYLSLPNVETLGYCRASLRDEKQILVELRAATLRSNLPPQ